MTYVTLATQRSPSCSFIDLPQEVSFQILIRMPKLNDLQSLLWTNKAAHQIVSTHFPLWKNLLAIRFPDSFKTISENANQFEAFRDLQAAKNNMGDNFWIKRALKGHEDELSWMETNRGKLISTAKDCCIKIWDAKGETLEKSIPFAAGEITRGMVVYEDKLYLISFSECSGKNYDQEKYIHRGIQKLEFGKAGALNLCQALAGGAADTYKRAVNRSFVRGAGPVETQARCSRAQRQGCQHSQNQLSNHDVYITDDVIRAYDIKKENVLTNGNEIALLKNLGLSKMKCLCAQGNLLFAGYTKEYCVPGNLIKDFCITIWDMDTHKRIHTIKIGENNDEDWPWYNEITCLAPSKNTLYSGHGSGSILAWDLKDYTFQKKIEGPAEPSSDEDSTFLGESTEEKIPITAMTLHKEQLIYAKGRTIIILDLIQGEKLCFLDDKEDVCRFSQISDGLLAASYGNHTKVVIWDLDARKKIWEKNGFNSLSSLAMHQGKLFVGSEKKEIEVFDFLFPYHHQLQLLNTLKEAKTNSELTKIHTELLLLAFAKKDRNKMIECVEKLLAVDPLNIEFSEFLCSETEGVSSLEYLANEKVPFDYKTGLRYANFDQIAKALVDFTEWLETKRNIQVDSPFKITTDKSSSDEEV